MNLIFISYERRRRLSVYFFISFPSISNIVDRFADMDLSKINISSYLPAMPYLVRDLVDKATNIVMNYSETETKVVEATNDESWGPPGKLLQELSQLSYSSEHYNEVNFLRRIIHIVNLYSRSWACFGNVVSDKINDIGDERIKYEIR